ncbi:GDYXXLXY domain-containing protein [Micavibrio aeruginosavorus]|uniref:GDYXXLXY domain-containing protein n=1 Tax=Micavibrio aeruginosavorus TaxID=349221 RepID=UPI003F4A8F69
MSEPMRKMIMLAVLVLPLLVPGLLWAKAATDQTAGPVWTVKIAGYDPRDLLHGRYIQFRYDWMETGEASPVCANGDHNCCLCLNGDQTYMNVTRVQCDAPDAAKICQSRIPVAVATGTQKYFIPEEFAADLDRLVISEPDRFMMEIAVPKAFGAPVIRGLSLDGMPLRDYLRANRGTDGLQEEPGAE